MKIGRNRHAAVAAFLALLCATLCGCLSVLRVPLPEHEAYSDGGDEFKWRVYPTVRMRCLVTAHVFSPIDQTKRGEDLYREKNKLWLAIPLALVWTTAPLDATVDTLFMPFDICRTAKTKGK